MKLPYTLEGSAEEKTALEAALVAGNIHGFRIKRIRAGLRLCLTIDNPSDFDRAIVCDALNDAGYVTSMNTPYNVQSFNQPHEIFIRKILR